MSWIKRKIRTLVEWLSPKHSVRFSPEIPDTVKGDTFYVIGDNNQPWVIIFECPCGCNELIHLNLLKDASPCWKYRINRKKEISIYPSVWRSTGCKSHFFVKRGKIDWVKEYENLHLITNN